MFQKIAAHFGPWPIAWLIVYAINLIMPLRMSGEVLGTGGRVGMWVAVVFLWLIGHLVCVWSKDIARVLVAGGACVGVSQFCPLLQILAGMISIQIVETLGQGTVRNEFHPTELTELGGFLATCLTGAQLLLAAALFGSPAASRLDTLSSDDRPPRGYP
jgi:hypothetical protein